MVDSRCSLKTFASIYPSKDAEDGGLSNTVNMTYQWTK